MSQARVLQRSFDLNLTVAPASANFTYTVKGANNADLEAGTIELGLDNILITLEPLIMTVWRTPKHETDGLKTSVLVERYQMQFKELQLSYFGRETEVISTDAVKIAVDGTEKTLGTTFDVDSHAAGNQISVYSSEKLPKPFPRNKQVKVTVVAMIAGET